MSNKPIIRKGPNQKLHKEAHLTKNNHRPNIFKNNSIENDTASFKARRTQPPRNIESFKEALIRKSHLIPVIFLAITFTRPDLTMFNQISQMMSLIRYYETGIPMENTSQIDYYFNIMYIVAAFSGMAITNSIFQKINSIINLQPEQKTL